MEGKERALNWGLDCRKSQHLSQKRTYNCKITNIRSRPEDYYYNDYIANNHDEDGNDQSHCHHE